MEFIPIKISQQGQHPHSELSFKSDCTEMKYIANGQITNIQTSCHQDTSKEQNLIFPTKFIKFFKLLSSSEFGRRFWFDDGNNFVQAGIDVSYDIDFGNIGSGDSKSDFMRYIYRDMVVPFTELEKENKHLREQLQRKDREIERKDQEMEQMKEQLQTKDQELKEKDQELEEMKEQLKELQEILKEKDQELKTSLLTASTLNEATLHHDRTLFGLTSAIDINCEKLQEKDQKLKNIQEELGNIQEELDTTYQELKELQEDFETKDQELKDAKEEVKTRGLLLKSCVEELKTYVEEVEEVEKKNQELEHLNHRLIYETSSFVERNSYFSPEM